MSHTILYIAATLVSALALVSCGSGSGTSDRTDMTVVADNEEQKSRLAEALNAGDLDNASQMADSMSLFVDDFTPEQTVQVLMAFLNVHNDAVAKKQSRRDLETLRKYIDVYDIALSVNPKDTRAAFDKARRLNPGINFDSLATSFRERLTSYDAIHDGSMTADTAEEPSAPADSASRLEEIPLELRPAN